MTQIPTTETDPTTYGARTWTLGETPWQQIPSPGGATPRVIIDNDFVGDPDDLYQLVHHLLSPSVDIRLVVASHLRPNDPFDPSGRSAESAARIVRDVFARMGLTSTEVIVTGSNEQLADRETAQPSAAADGIIAEAMRDDTTAPLFYVAGGGLTDLASAYLTEPRIAERLTVIWIGGAEHEGLAVPPPNAMPIEFNLLIDVLAAQVVFADSSIPIWQVPRDVYRQCLVPDVELRRRVAAAGPLGRYLYDEVAHFVGFLAGILGASGTFALGDSPLVLLTALRSVFESDSSSSQHVDRPTPAIEDDGSYTEVAGARPMRVYTGVDTRLMLEDFYLKLEEFEIWQASENDGAA